MTELATTDPAASWTARPLSVHVPPGERRNPVATVRLAVGPLELVLAVSRLKKSGLAVRPPMAEGGMPAVGAAPEVWAVIEKVATAAVAADPAAREHVLASCSSGWATRRWSRPTDNRPRAFRSGRLPAFKAYGSYGCLRAPALRSPRPPRPTGSVGIVARARFGACSRLLAGDHSDPLFSMGPSGL